jgi:hypothetical protein
MGQQSAVEKRARYRASKESASQQSVPSEHAIAGSAFEDTAVLQHVLAFLGPGHHLSFVHRSSGERLTPM